MLFTSLLFGSDTEDNNNHILCFLFQIQNSIKDLTPFEAREYLRAQKPCSLPPASRIQTAQTTDNAPQSWGRSPVQVLMKKRSVANTTSNNKATPLQFIN